MHPFIPSSRCLISWSLFPPCSYHPLIVTTLPCRAGNDAKFYDAKSGDFVWGTDKGMVSLPEDLRKHDMYVWGWACVF